MKVNHIQPPKRKASRKIDLPEKLVREVANDLKDSVEFEPFGVNDGEVYETATKAFTAASRLITAVSRLNGEDPRWIKRRVWELDGKESRDEPGKWVFALSRRGGDELPPKKERKRKETATV